MRNLGRRRSESGCRTAVGRSCAHAEHGEGGEGESEWDGMGRERETKGKEARRAVEGGWVRI